MNQYLPCVEAALSELASDKYIPRKIYELYKMEYCHGPQCSHKSSGSSDQQTEEHILTISHKCISQACTDSACMLCNMNPIRQCGDNYMQEKYFEEGNIYAKCGEPFYMELKKKATGELAKLDGELVLALVDGQAYDRAFQGAASLCSDNFESQLKLNHRGKPVLYCATSSYARMESDGVHITMKGGVAIFPVDLRISVSSISLFGTKSGRYRLLTRVVPGSGQLPPANLTIASVSPSFATLTQRSKLAQKKEKPYVTDDISKLDRMGNKRHEKLKTLGHYLDLPFLPQSVATVADFQQLARCINGNSDVKQQILGWLCVSEEDWGLICDHADQAIHHDTKMRCWKPVNGGGRINKLIYRCSSGQIDFTYGPVALQYGHDIILKNYWTSGQLCQAQKFDKLAREYWWEPDHCGWSILPMTLEQFEQNPAAAAEDWMTLENVSKSLSSMSMDIDNVLNLDEFSSLPVHSPFEQTHCQELALPSPLPHNIFSDSLPDLGNQCILKNEYNTHDLFNTYIKSEPYPFDSTFQWAKQEEPECLELDEKSSLGLQVEIPWVDSRGLPTGMNNSEGSEADQQHSPLGHVSEPFLDEDSPNNVFHSTPSSDLEAQMALYQASSREQM